MGPPSDTNGAPPHGGHRTLAPRPCPRDGGSPLKALVTGACALILCVTPIASGASPGESLSDHVATMKKDRAVLAFFEHNAWLLTDPRFAKEARHQVKLHTASLRASADASNRDAARAPGSARRAPLPGRAPRAPVAQQARARGGDLQGVRVLLRRGPPRLALRVRVADRRPERPVPRALPDGLERASALRARSDADRAGQGSAPILRLVRSRLEPVVVQALVTSWG